MVGFEDPDSLELKIDFLKARGLRSLMVWAIVLDHFQNVCEQAKNTLLSAADKAVGAVVFTGATDPPITSKHSTTQPGAPANSSSQ